LTAVSIPSDFLFDHNSASLGKPVCSVQLADAKGPLAETNIFVAILAFGLDAQAKAMWLSVSAKRTAFFHVWAGLRQPFLPEAHCRL